MSDLLIKLAEKNNINLNTSEPTTEERIAALEDAMLEMVIGGTGA